MKYRNIKTKLSCLRRRWRLKLNSSISKSVKSNRSPKGRSLWFYRRTRIKLKTTKSRSECSKVRRMKTPRRTPNSKSNIRLRFKELRTRRVIRLQSYSKKWKMRLIKSVLSRCRRSPLPSIRRWRNTSKRLQTLIKRSLHLIRRTSRSQTGIFTSLTTQQRATTGSSTATTRRPASPSSAATPTWAQRSRPSGSSWSSPSYTKAKKST